MTVRMDRKFWTSLNFHKAVAEEFKRNPASVRAIALKNAELVARRIRSTDGKALVQRWGMLLESKDDTGVIAHLTSSDPDDELSVDMRNVTVFSGVLPEEERLKIFSEVNRSFREAEMRLP